MGETDTEKAHSFGGIGGQRKERSLGDRSSLSAVHSVRSGSQTFWSQDAFTVKIIEDPKEFLFMWVRSVHIYWVVN